MSTSLKRILFTLFVVTLAAFSAMGGVVVGGLAVYSALQSEQAQPQSTIIQPTVENPYAGQSLKVGNTDIETSITEAVEKTGPAVVTVVGELSGQPSFFGVNSGQEVSGSGVIISADGYILTNNHVVEDVDTVYVILADGSELPAEIIGTEAFADLAVLKADGTMPAVATLGNSDTLKPGETVIAIGSPLGEFKNTVTVGVLSATGRSLDTNQGYQMEDLLQTDAAINQGNSGGPLVNLNGEVIGINTLIVRGMPGSAVAEGLGFAIPSNSAHLIAEQIIDNGYFARPYLGIRWQLVYPQLAQRYGLATEWGAYVTEVVPNSPADLGGLKVGDIITKIGENSINEDQSFVNALFANNPGSNIRVEILRDQTPLSLEITLGELPN